MSNLSHGKVSSPFTAVVSGSHVTGLTCSSPSELLPNLSQQQCNARILYFGGVFHDVWHEFRRT